ncbi:hypothetical protein U1Q18_039859 [Sarracenia purpurea var. burkii]
MYMEIGDEESRRKYKGGPCRLLKWRAIMAILEAIKVEHHLLRRTSRRFQQSRRNLRSEEGTATTVAVATGSLRETRQAVAGAIFWVVDRRSLRIGRHWSKVLIPARFGGTGRSCRRGIFGEDESHPRRPRAGASRCVSGDFGAGKKNLGQFSGVAALHSVFGIALGLVEID